MVAFDLGIVVMSIWTSGEVRSQGGRVVKYMRGRGLSLRVLERAFEGRPDVCAFTFGRVWYG